jgi:hypothetical protein
VQRNKIAAVAKPQVRGNFRIVTATRAARARASATSPVSCNKTELNRDHNETTGQSPQNERRDQNRANEERRQNRTNEGANVNERENRTTGQGAAGSRADVSITAEQRTRIHEVILKERSAPRISSVNFDVRVGTRVPRTVRFAPLPLTIIEIEPAWRGYEYFLVGEEIVVVDPNTLEIVAVIET